MNRARTSTAVVVSCNTGTRTKRQPLAVSSKRNGFSAVGKSRWTTCTSSRKKLHKKIKTGSTTTRKIRVEQRPSIASFPPRRIALLDFPR
ncbi:hypothetical protein SCHPADRAFT_54472 [Schizopora paradoxa]|uniref:Uncharacterized protein n=1 Tax=Schizopora paradoxa TaxID=27342 RepID=A0A0H2S641_9AGAM|nr:hypothetical protein SCHPADRAFT_54472 [Schizopora paradoxa]